jgi:hypothetical protein
MQMTKLTEFEERILDELAGAIEGLTSWGAIEGRIPWGAAVGAAYESLAFLGYIDRRDNILPKGIADVQRRHPEWRPE